MKIVEKIKNRKPKEEIKRINSRPEIGLSNYQVNLREYQRLSNDVEVKVNRSYWNIIYKNCFTFFNILLIILGIILIVCGQWSSCVFLGILVLNTCMGLFQDIRAKKAVDKLSLTTKDKVRVIRDGKIRLIEPEKLVLDDVMVLKNDENVPCDGIVLKGEARLNESLITGESNPQRKIMGDSVLSGTYVITGEIYVRVDKIGNQNYIATLQDKTKEFKRPQSLIYSKLNYLFKIIAILVIILGFFMLWEFGLFENTFATRDNFVAGIGAIAGSLVSMIPSGMYLLSSTSLAVGIINLSSKHVLVRDLYSTESLARVDTLCIDKTGTITDGTMSVYHVEIIKDRIREERLGAYIASLLDKTKDSNYTAKALEKEYGRKEIFKVDRFVPFDSSIKYSAASFVEGGTIVIGALGYFDITEQRELKTKINKYSADGFRTLVVGMSSKNIDKKNNLPTKIVPVAIIVLQDSIRANVDKTIAWFNENNVNIKVISGDNPITVSKISSVVGIKNADKYISLEGMSLEEVASIVDEYTIFGRVSPEQKEVIVKSLREKKHTVAMFGDGVNDILAMKSADVSISIKSGSRASRDIANLVLLNDDFDSLPQIVAQGRRVINNLQRTCSLFLTKTIFAVLLNIFFLGFGVYTSISGDTAVLWPFSTNNFYIWELLNIGIAAFLLALEPNNERLEGGFLKNIFKKATPNGVIMFLSIMGMVLTCYFMLEDGAAVLSSDTWFITISVYYISIYSLIVLFFTCFKFDLYRVFVFIGIAILDIVAVGVNLLANGTILKTTSSIDNLDYLILLFIALAISIVLGVIFFLLNEVSKKRKRLREVKE